MNILIYKRTHAGDPNSHGIFGVHDCMGRIRDLDFDSVIGVGGISEEPVSYGINEKINWVGCEAQRKVDNGRTQISFKYFCLLESQGPRLSTLAPNLAKRLYEKNTRYILHSYSSEEKKS